MSVFAAGKNDTDVLGLLQLSITVASFGFLRKAHKWGCSSGTYYDLGCHAAKKYES